MNWGPDVLTRTKADKMHVLDVNPSPGEIPSGAIVMLMESVY